jgi:hypothetical protein
MWDRGGQSGIVAGFLRLLPFPLPIIPLINPHLAIIHGWYNRPNSGRHSKGAQSQTIPKDKQQAS